VIKVPVIALAGSLAAKKISTAEPARSPDATPDVSSAARRRCPDRRGLTFFPALALGPIVEHLMLH